MENKRYLIIYHGDDNDGVVSGAILYDYLIRKKKVPEASIETFAANYNKLKDWWSYITPNGLREKYDVIIMTDISFNDSNCMKALWDEYKYDFIWCDHHRPIIKESVEKKFHETPGIRQTDRSAILCVWKYLYDPFDLDYNNKNIPEFFSILSAIDSWTFKERGYDKDYVTDVNKGVTSTYNLDFNAILKIVTSIVSNWEKKLIPDDYMLNIIETCRMAGHNFNSYDAQKAERLIKEYGDNTWSIQLPDGSTRTACALFTQGGSNSSMFKTCLNSIQNGIVFKHQKNGDWAISLYNKTDDSTFHCGDFLKKKYNGGGHEGAAGCTISQKQFIDILLTKTL